MSIDEIASIRDDIAESRKDIATLSAIVTERNSTAERNGKILSTLAAAVLFQILATVFFAGQKSEKLDDLSKDVADIHNQIQNIRK
jgi:hypothetical protein